MTAQTVHRLGGLESDNLLAFLALLGAMRAFEHAAPDLHVRASWDVERPPLRPLLHLARPIEQPALTEVLARGVAELARAHDFDGRADLNLDQSECRAALVAAARGSSASHRERADLLSALMHDAAVKDAKGADKVAAIDPTPLCLLFGQGHQHFLARLATVPTTPAPPARGQGKQAIKVTAEQVLDEALFEVWHRQDPTKSFRWDPGEDVRYATMGGDPTDPAFKSGTQHGANRLAAIGLAALPLAARTRSGRVRPTVVGDRRDAEGFAFGWPIWKLPMRLAGVVAVLGHPELSTSGKLAHLGVIDVYVARRISVGKFMNFTRGRPLG